MEWKTNKEEADPLYPSYVAFFTDFSLGRQQPLRTDLRGDRRGPGDQLSLANQ